MEKRVTIAPMEDKQTAVEWLLNELRKFEEGTSEYFSKSSIESHAFRMNKEQIKEAFDKGYSYYHYDGGGKRYYEETYES